MAIDWAPTYVNPAFGEGQRQGGEILRQRMALAAHKSSEQERLASEERRAAGVQEGETARQREALADKDKYQTSEATKAAGLGALLKGGQPTETQLGSEHPEGITIPGRPARTPAEVYPTLTPEEQRGAMGPVSTEMTQSAMAHRQMQVEIAKRDAHIQTLETMLNRFGMGGGQVPEGMTPSIHMGANPSVTLNPSAEAKSQGSMQGRLNAQGQNLDTIRDVSEAGGYGRTAGGIEAKNDFLPELIKIITALTGANMNARANGPVGKGATEYYNPKTGQTADQVPGGPMYNHDQLTNGSSDFIRLPIPGKDFQKYAGSYNVAMNHIDQVEKLIPKVFPPADEMKSMTRQAYEAYVAGAYRKFAGQSAINQAALRALGAQGLNISQAMTPVGARSGLGLLMFFNSGQPTELGAPFSRESAMAAMRATRNGVESSYLGRTQSIPPPGGFRKFPGATAPGADVPEPAQRRPVGKGDEIFDPKKGDFK